MAVSILWNAWAHLINVEKHGSYEDPPDLPYFRGFKKPKIDEAADSSSCTSPTQESSTATGATAATASVSLRSECIDQLDKWHVLLKKGAISQSHYEEIQSLIMKDIHSS